MSTNNERPDCATRQVTPDDNKPKHPKEVEKKMEELRVRLQMEKATELERQKEILMKNYEAELHRILHEKEKELKEARSETKKVKEGLTLQVRDAERRLAHTPPVCKEGVSRKLVTEVVELKGVKRRLEEALGDVMDSDKKKAYELRKLHDEHSAELGRFKREAETEIRKLLAELKFKDRIIRQLKRELWVANDKQERLVKYQCQPQNQDKPKEGSQDDRNEKTTHTHNLTFNHNSSLKSNLNLNGKNSNKRKYVCNSTQNSDIEEKQPHDADDPDVKHKERKILKTGQVPENMYKRLYKEHLELQRSFALLRQMVADTKGDKDKGKNITSLADENQRLKQISQLLKTKIQKLRNELKESKDQNELLEFCVLEMENQGKAALVPNLVECGVNTETPGDFSSTVSESSEFDALVEVHPLKELDAEHVKEIKKGLTCIYTAQGTNSSSKRTLVQAAAHIQAASIAMSNLQNLVSSLTKNVESLRKEKESHVCCNSEANETCEKCKQHLEETRKRLSDVSEQLSSMQRREATLSHLEAANRKFKEHLQIILQDFQVLLSDCPGDQEMDVQNLREKISELYKIEKEVILQAEQAGIPQALPNPLKVEEEINIHSLKSSKSSKSSDAVDDTDTQLKVNIQTIEKLKLELQKKELVTEEFSKDQKELLQKCNELSAKLTEYEAIKYDLTQKIVMLEKSEQDLVEKNLKLYIDYVSAKEEVQKLLAELESRQKILSPTSPLELKNIVPIQCSDVQRTLSEESGTMTSEDEGLGEESRRGDSTGPSSLADLQESEDLFTRTSDFESETSDEHKIDTETPQNSLLDGELNKYFVKECESIKLKWKKEVTELKERENLLMKQLKHSQTQISELHANLKVKEEQVRQLLGKDCLLAHSEHHEEERKQVVKNMQVDLVETEGKLPLTEHSKDSLKEQALELEEAENNARLDDHKLQGNFIQRECDECKSCLDKSPNNICSHSATEIELHSQIKYMEFLTNKYEDYIKELETSKMKLQKRVLCLEQLLHSAEALTNGIDQSVIEKTNEMLESSYKSSDCSADKILESSPGLDTTRTFSQFPTTFSKDIQGDSLPIQCRKLSSLCSRAIPCVDGTSDLKWNSPAITCSKLSPFLATNLNTWSNSVQKELVQRLNMLEKGDHTLREQLHQMDGMNLELWKKLHSLEIHIGKCRKECIPELNETSPTFPNHHKCNSSSIESANGIPFNQSDTKVKRLNQAIESKEFSETKNYNFSDSVPSSTESILQRVLLLETSEHKLKDRLLQLENINHEFEMELEIRENLYKEKETQQRKWLEVENSLQAAIRTLENEKSSLLNKVLQLEEEKLVLNKNIENLQIELETLKMNHSRELKELELQKGRALDELKEKQNKVGTQTKEKAQKIAKLEQSVVNASSPRTLEFNLEKYNLLNDELEMLKKDHAALNESSRNHKDTLETILKDFEKQFHALISLQKSEEEKLKLQIDHLVTKEKEHNLQIIETLQKQTALENELILKETELEQVKKQFSEQMKLLEDEHHVVETELKWKMKEMEENAAITIKALTEERSRLENNLQADLRDLHIKEESYKVRIAELESHIENLRREVNQITRTDSTSENERVEHKSGNQLFIQKIEELQNNEKQMKEKLAEMEKKEEAYKETLEHAEKIIFTIEHNYNDKIEELESSERALKLRVSQLEEVENRLRCTLHNEKRTSEMRKASDLIEELMEGEIRELALRERIKELESNQKTLLEKLQEMKKSRRYLQEELGDHDEMVRTIEKLQQQQEVLKKELLSVQQSENALRETLDHADDILIQREDELRISLARIEDEKKELEETTAQLRKQVKELQTVIETSQYGKVSPIGEQLYETYSNCDSEEDFHQNDENFYVPEKTDCDVEKVRELERMGTELKQEVTHLKQSLSAANIHLIDLDNVNRNQQTTISQLVEEKSRLQKQIKNSEELENKCRHLEKLCNEQEREKLLLQQSVNELQEKHKWWEGLKDLNSRLQEQVMLLQKQLNQLNPDCNSITVSTAQRLNLSTSDKATTSNEHSTVNEIENQSACFIQECREINKQNYSELCNVHVDTSSIIKKYEVQKLAKLCQTVLNNVTTAFELNTRTFDKVNNQHFVNLKEHCKNVIKDDTLPEEMSDATSDDCEYRRHSPIPWSAGPGTVSLDDLTTGLEAQLELEQCVKSAMAAMEREMMQKDTSQTTIDHVSISSTATSVDSASSKALPLFVEHSSHISNSSKGTITKCKTKILDVSELHQPQKNLLSVIPHPPSNFRILRQVGDHSLLVGWSVPTEGCTIGGYQIFVDGQLHQKVRSPDRTKALLPKINVFQPVNVSIYSISNSGHTSEPVSVHHPGAVSKPELPLCKKEMPYLCITEHSCVLRIRTVFNEGYDAVVQKGSNVLVCSAPDLDGFCTVQVEGQEGKLPFSVLKEVQNLS